LFYEKLFCKLKDTIEYAYNILFLMKFGRILLPICKSTLLLILEMFLAFKTSAISKIKKAFEV